MKILDIFRSRIVLFIIQILILSLVIIYFDYNITLNFDNGISTSRQIIIQLLANYVLFNDLSGLIFIYLIWIMVSLIPIIVYNNFKKAYSTNLITFFFPNFFLYTFLYYYSRVYFNSYFLYHFVHSILLGLCIASITLVISFFLKKAKKVKPQAQVEDLEIITRQVRQKCPKCGTEFNSNPTYCYNCNTKLIIKSEEDVGVR